jgi:hypothetical protein
LPLAGALVWWGARTDRPWTVPVGAVLALPIVWVHGLVIALAALPFVRGREVRGRDYAASLATALGLAVAAILLVGEPLERVLVEASAALMAWLP